MKSRVVTKGGFKGVVGWGGGGGGGGCRGLQSPYCPRTPWEVKWNCGSRDGNGKKIGKWLSEISEAVSVRIRSVSILRDENWKETKIRLSEISESISLRIRSVFILMWMEEKRWKKKKKIGKR